MFRILMALFIEASEAFINSETDLIMSGVSERCMCGSLMLFLRRELDNSDFSNYYSDIEYNRNFEGRIKTIIDDDMRVINITCDLIVHSRGQLNPDNLIAIEMKRDDHPESEKNKDRIRLRALTKNMNEGEIYIVNGINLPEHVCGYALGVFYEISITQRLINIEYYCNGEFYKNYIRRF